MRKIHIVGGPGSGIRKNKDLYNSAFLLQDRKMPVNQIYRRKFAESLERALKIIASDLKVGADNLELMLTEKDMQNLGEMVEILNQCEIEYKKGKPKKLQNLIKAVSDYKKGDQDYLRCIFVDYIALRDAELGKNKLDPFSAKVMMLNTLKSWSKAQYYV